MVNLELYRIFITVAECENITKTSSWENDSWTRIRKN